MNEISEPCNNIAMIHNYLFFIFVDLHFLELTNPVKLPPSDDGVSNGIMIDNTGFPTFNNPEPHTSLYVSTVQV